MSVSVTFLGGLGEIGRNCAAIEVAGKIALIDCGLMFPEADMPGIDLIFPDWSWIFKRKKDVVCVVLTHGHEDHVGSLGYFLRECNVPVYGTKLTVEIAKRRVEELGVGAKFHKVDDLDWVEAGPFKFQFVPVSHSIPDGSAIAFDTPEGIVIHSGDFKLDPTPVDGRATDLPTLAELGNRGVRLLLSDSTNAERPGFVASETSLATEINDIINRAEGRVVAACFASHVHRVQQLADAAIANGRTIAFQGRSMFRISEIAQSLGLLKIPDSSIVEIEELLRLPEKHQMLIMTGSQGEPFAALSLMAGGRHRSVDLSADDTILISATPIPGNEKAVSRVINNLHRSGAKVYHGRNRHLHVSGHGAEDELKTFLNVIRPQALVPVHGEYRHLRAHEALGKQMRVPHIQVCEDGDRIELKGNKTIHHPRDQKAPYIYFDGGADVTRSVMKERGALAEDGVLVITVAVNMKTSRVTMGPDIDAKGVSGDSDEMRDAVAAAVQQAIEGIGNAPTVKRIHELTRQAARVAIKPHTKTRPVLIPTVLEV